jgi:hypothetical protein
MKRLVAVGTALAFATSAMAQQTVQALPRIEALPMAQCTVPAAAARLKMETTYNSARVAEQQMKILDLWRALSNKGKPNRPVSETLSKDDLQKWGQLDQQYDAGALVQLVESMRERDINVLLKQAQLADAEYRWGTRPEEGSPDYMAYAVLGILRVTWKDNYVLYEPPRPAPCSLDYALAKLADEPLQKSTELTPQFRQANAWADQLLAKYKMRKLDESKISKEELATLNKYRAEVYAPLDRTATYVRDLAILREMAQASDIMYDANRRDAAIGAGDPNVIGTSVERRKEAGEFDERMKVAIGTWNLINEKIPAPIVAHWKEMSEKIEQIKQRAK